MRSVTLIGAAVVCWVGTAAAQEHGGTPVEHAGQAAEHAGHGAAGYTAEQIKTAMNGHIQSQLQQGGGVYRLTDDKTGEKLELEFVKIHDPVRKIEGKGYFACTDFRPKGAAPDRLYDIDFWLNPKDGKLAVTEVRVHKEPKLVGGKWTRLARYTFENDKAVEVK